MNRGDEVCVGAWELDASRMSHLDGLFPLMLVTLPNVVSEVPDRNDLGQRRPKRRRFQIEVHCVHDGLDQQTPGKIITLMVRCLRSLISSFNELRTTLSGVLRSWADILNRLDLASVIINLPLLHVQLTLLYLKNKIAT